MVTPINSADDLAKQTEVEYGALAHSSTQVPLRTLLLSRRLNKKSIPISFQEFFKVSRDLEAQAEISVRSNEACDTRGSREQMFCETQKQELTVEGIEC